VRATPSISFATLQQHRAELAQLQGAWCSIAGRRQAELLIAGNLFTVKFHDGALYMGSLDIDLDETPHAMDMRIDEGPIKHKGRFARCIYELDGDTLRWCPGDPCTDERPSAFADEQTGDGLCLVFRREYPRWHNW
jgi:uncharacterized protein (TIGR03067 family)